MHIQIMYLLSAYKIECMHKFGNLERLKLSRIVLNNSDYFMSSEFTTVSFPGDLLASKEI